MNKGEWGKIKAFFDLRTEEGFVIKGFKLIHGINGLFVGNPSQKGNDGEYYDPYDISGVTIFSQAANLSPSSVITDNLISSSVTSGNILMHFSPSGDDGGFPAQDPSGYSPGTDIRATSGVYRVKKGEYVAVLDDTQDISGIYNLHGSSVTIGNTASAVNNYIDCWTIKFAAGSLPQTLVNTFQLYNDNPQDFHS